jgi:hypothetical protein
MVQNKFGLNNNAKSFRVLRTESESSAVPTPQDPKLAALAQSLKLAGPTTPATPTELKKPGSATDLVTSGTIGINRVLGKVKSVTDQIRKPINDIANASRQVGRAVRDAQGIIQQGALIKQDFNNAVGEAKKLGVMLGILDPEAPSGAAKDRYGVKYGSVLGGIDSLDYYVLDYTDWEDKSMWVESSKAYNRESNTAWTLTTVADQVKGKAPIQFFVNPSKVSIGSEYVEALEFVQRGNFYTRWRSMTDKRAFPNLSLQFTFQSSNILPETYSSEYTTSTEEFVPVDGREAPSLVRTFSSDVSFTTPPGIENFYDILEILNQPTTIDNDLLPNQSIETKKFWYGQPNFVILRLSTRTFPLMTVKGFFQQGWSLEESAENPLSFDIPLKIIAFESDPPWWDRKQIFDRYNDTYNNTVNVLFSASTAGSQAIQQTQQDIKKSSKLDPEALKAASEASNGNEKPDADAPPAGEALANVPSTGFSSDVQAGVALGNIGLREFTDTRSSLYDSKASYNTARVGDTQQTTLQLSTGENYVQYLKPNGGITTTWALPGSPGWTSYTSAPDANGTRTVTATDSAGKQILASTR